MAEKKTKKEKKQEKEEKRKERASRKFWKEFKEFIKEYKVVTVAIGFVLGAAASDLAKSFVNNIFMPLIDPFLPGGSWETATFAIGAINIGWGAFLSSLLQFAILAAVVFLLVKKLMKYE